MLSERDSLRGVSSAMIRAARSDSDNDAREIEAEEVCCCCGG